MKLKLLLIALPLLTTVLHAQLSIRTESEQIPLNTHLLGLNGRSTEGPSWSSSSFKTLVAEMNPAHVRYPAGTQGNKWNWKTGNFITGHGNSSYTYTIPMLIKGLPQRSKIIYMVNMVLPTPQTGITFETSKDEILKTEETLNAKIADMLNALSEFETNGHLPDAVELGNELYFNNEEAGVYAADPVFYMAHAKIITQAIKQKYPGIKILICTTKGGTKGRDNWNNNVFSILKNDPGFNAMVYAVVQHHYINDKYGYLDPVTDNSIAELIAREGTGYVHEIKSDYNLVPDDLRLWITEFGATKRTSDGMWASGLRAANMILGFMELGPKVDNLIWQHITDNPNVLNTTQMKTGPAGMAIAQLNQAMEDKTSYCKLSFGADGAGDANIYGYKFSNNNEESILIVNHGSNEYLRTNLSGLFQGTEVIYARQYWSTSLINSPVYNGSGYITTQTAKNIYSYNLRPYSVTAFRVRKNTTSIGQPTEAKPFGVYPTVTDHFFTVINSSDTKAYGKLYSSTGKMIAEHKINREQTDISVAALPSGIYFLTIHSPLGNFSHKLIRK